MTTVLVTPLSEKITLAAGVAEVVSGSSCGTVTAHIPTGTTALIQTTCATAEEIQAETADWVDWPHGTKAGPFIDVLVGNVTAIKMTSAAGGSVYLCRSN